MRRPIDRAVVGDVQREVFAMPGDWRDALVDAGIVVADLEAEADFAIDTYASAGLDYDQMGKAAFLAAFELGVRCARAVDAPGASL